MKIAIYSPYLDTAGGGEKYILTIAQILKKIGRVDVLLDAHLTELGSDNLKTQNEGRHGLDLSEVNFIKAPIGVGSSSIGRFLFLLRYDWFFYETDGSWFYSSAKNNIIHFQVPFTKLPNLNFWQRLKLSSWKLAIYNSKFTSETIESQLPIKGQVIYPPVDVEDIKPLKKQKQILSVGRFSAHTKSKKHDILIEGFKKLSENKVAQDWSLHLAGGVLEEDKEYLDQLKSLADGYNVFFYPNISLEDLRKLYGISNIYWHAAGFEETEPEKFEHFGISTVESMAGGCVPVVINKGGQKEIVTNNINGFLWNDLGELVDLTIKLIKDYNLLSRLSEAAQTRANNFSYNKFKEEIEKITHE